MDTCILCKSSKKDDIQYGEFLKNKSFGVHTFCLYLSSNLSQNGKDDEGFLGFLEADIKKEVQRIALLKCFYCHGKYANIGCCERKCRHTFHLICGLENKAENQFCNDYRSFCHRHVRSVSERPAATETCLICFDSLCGTTGKFNKVNMILSPCCRNGWFHKLCLQKCAKTAGYFFKCPLCNDSDVFRRKLPARGIFIPNQDAAWELEPNAFAELLERPSECSAQLCKNKKGRKASSDLNPLVMCSTCGSTAMHRQCLPSRGKRFHCADCTIALEERDSGRESLHLPNDHVNNEDEDIEVCYVSEREDFDIVNRLMAAQTREPQTKRDQNHYDSESSDEEIKPTNNKLTSRRLRTDSENCDLPQVSQTCKFNRRRIISETESSEDNSEIKEIRPTKKSSFKRIKTDSESSDIKEHKEAAHENSSTSSDEEIVRATCKKRNLSTIVISDSEDDLNEEITTKHKRLYTQAPNPKDKKDLDWQNLSVVTEDSDDDDPLENFSKFMEKDKNISCIALRTRRSININAPLQLQKQHTSNEKENIKNEANLTTRNTINKEKATTKDLVTEKPKRNKYVDVKDKQTAHHKTKFDISCIAKRTRRKSVGSWSNNKTAAQTLQESKESPSKVSCIALRSRRKTICAQSLYKQKFFHEESLIYEKLHESDDDGNGDGDDEISDTKSLLNEVSVDTDLNNFIVIHDSYEENYNISKFEISCIAKRTRRRKSALQNSLPEDEYSNDSCSTTDSSSNSHLSSCSSNINIRKRKSLHTALQNSLPEDEYSNDSCSTTDTSSNSHLSSCSSNINIRKRCHQSITSSSSEEFESPQQPTSSRQILKTKILKSDLLLDKLPQHNYAAYLKSKYITKSSTLNSVHNYRPPNNYNLHSSNRKSF